MKAAGQSIQKVFLFLGIGLMTIGISLLFIEFYSLVILYSLTGMLITYFYYAYSITLLEDRMIYRNFWFQKKSIEWETIVSVNGTLSKSIIIQYDIGKIAIVDVFKDRRGILDHIIKHVDKTVVSGQLMDEWSQFFTLYHEDFKNESPDI